MVSVALQDQPAFVEDAGGEVVFAYPQVEATAVAPHHVAVVFVGIDLQQQFPVGSAGRQHFAAFAFVGGAVTAVFAVADQLAFEFHIALDVVGMAEQFVPFFASEFVPLGISARLAKLRLAAGKV